MKKIIYIATIGITLLTTSCDDFLDRQVPQGIVTGDQIASPEYVDNLVISAYAIWATGDDINSSFSLWNYDVRSDDCYKGGSGTEDGGVFNALEISKGINTPTGISMIYGKDCINASPVPTQLCNHSTKWMKRPIR